MVKLTMIKMEATVVSEGNVQVKQDSYFTTSEFWINPKHVSSVSPITVYSGTSVIKATRLETNNSSFIVVGTPAEIQEKLSTEKSLLKG